MKIRLLIIIGIIFSGGIVITNAYGLCAESDGTPEPCFDSYQISHEKITEKSIMENYARNIELNYDDWQMSDRNWAHVDSELELPAIVCTEFVADGMKQYRMAQWVDNYKISDWEDHYNPSLCDKWLAPIDVPIDVPEPVPDTPIYEDCGPGTILQDEICVVTFESKPDETNGTWESSYQKLPPPNLRASCAFDGAIAMWFYQFIVNPLCEVDIQIIPDYECNCDF